MVMKNSLLIYLFISFSVVAGPVDDHKPFAKEINNNATDSVKTGDPWNVPNYEEPHPNYDHLMNNSEQLKQEGAAATSNSEAAQVIYGLPKRDTSFKDDTWFKNAQNIEKNPDNVLDLSGEESQCTTTTIPGEKYVENVSCIDAETSVEKSCSEGVVVEVDADYDYQCNKTRESEGKSCAVGRIINVTKTNRYRCTKTQIFTEETCEQWWEIIPSNTTACDYGWDKSGNICVRPANITCPAGESLNGAGQCVATVKTAATPVCSAGSYNGSTRMCDVPIKDVPMPHGNCPILPNFGPLKRVVYSGAGYWICTYGGAAIDPSYVCSAGETLSNSECVRQVTHPANKQCPAESQLLVNGCNSSGCASGSVADNLCGKAAANTAPTMKWHDNCAQKGIGN
nr:hypothetical protein [Aeromonas salmonicida]